ncbi:MAG: GNAT family N-acetyltransferase [Ferruginibacter sp.]
MNLSTAPIKSKPDVDIIHNYLCNESYWAKNIPVELVKKSIDGSCCFGLYVKENPVLNQTPTAGRQVGFARVISDCATFGYLADVFILDAYRGKGLSKWLMETIMNCPDLQGLRRWLLATKDAHGLYTKFGFLPLDKPERIMGFKPFEAYPQNNS